MPARQYGLVAPPPAPDPLSSLSNLMTMGRQMQAYGDEDDARKKRHAVETALNAAKGDPDAAAGLLEKGGDWATARAFRENTKQERLKSLGQVTEMIDSHKDVMSRGAEFLTQVDAKPELYPQLRPKLVELAASVNPELANLIPETYDPTEVRNMLTWVNTNAQALDMRAKAAADAKLKLTAKEEGEKNDSLDRRIVSNWFSVSPNQQDWDQSIAAARHLGVSDAVIGQLGPQWSQDAVERAKAMGLDPKDRKPQEINTIEEAIVKAQGANDKASVDALVGLQKRLSDAKRNETGRRGATAQEIAAVIKHPEIWSSLTPTLRDEMLGPLANSGFDFKAASSQLTDANRAQIERWKADQLDQLETEFADRQVSSDGIPPLKPIMSPDQLNQRKLAIENGYRAQLGMEPVTALPASWGTTGGGGKAQGQKPPVATPTPTATPTATPAPKPAATATPAAAPASGKEETRAVRLAPGQQPMVFTQTQWKAFVAAAKAKGVTISSDPFASQ